VPRNKRLENNNMQNRLNDCLDKTMVYQATLKEENQYTGDAKKLEEVVMAYRTLTVAQQEAFDNYLERRITDNTSPDIREKAQAGEALAVVGGVVMRLADAYFFGPSSFFRTIGMMASGAAIGYVTGVLGTGAPLTDELTDTANANRRLNKPFMDIQAAVGGVDPITATLNDVAHKTAEGLRHS
jgi:hypothetical protein